MTGRMLPTIFPSHFLSLKPSLYITVPHVYQNILPTMRAFQWISLSSRRFLAVRSCFMCNIQEYGSVVDTDDY